jgi:hypothetical protein
MPRGKTSIVHWTDPEYLNAFYRSWGSGQSTTVRQSSQNGETDKAADTRAAPKKGAQKRSGKM